MNIPIDPREKRKELGLNQTKFWGAIGVTQSCGSRWESDKREMPECAGLLLYLATAREEKALEELRAIRRKMRRGGMMEQRGEASPAPHSSAAAGQDKGE